MLVGQPKFRACSQVNGWVLGDRTQLPARPTKTIGQGGPGGRQKEEEMPTGTRYFIQTKGGGWVLASGGRTLRQFDTKKDALDEGVKRAKAAKGQLVIKDRDGKIQSERTYGNDPYPPRRLTVTRRQDSP